MPLRPDMEPKEFLDIFLRRKWLIIFSFLFILLGASVYCVVTPEKYISSTTILVIPQRVPEGYVRSTVSTRIEERLATINQQVMSRTRLLAVMQDLELFKEERKRLPAEDVVENMRKRIALQVKGNDAFSLSFVHENPKTAMLTASRLASFFIDENLKNREAQAVGTADFLEAQLQENKAKLEAKEQALGDYKTRHMGELPQQMEPNLRMLTQLQDQAKVNAENIRYQEDRKEILEMQLRALEAQDSSRQPAGRGPTPAGDQKSADSPSSDNTRAENFRAGVDPAEPLLSLLQSKKEQLAALQLRYTDSYPGMLRIRQEISLLEAKIEETRRIAASQGAARETPQPATGKVQPAVPSREASVSDGNQQLESLREKLRGARLEMAALKRERDDIQKNLSVYKAKVEGIPRREQELISLNRDYENLKKTYDDLLRKKMDAEIASNLEKRQKGEQFHILDPANLPAKPFVPNRPLVFAISFAIAAFVGFGGAIGIEYADQSVRGTREFRHYVSEVPVLVSVPIIRDSAFEKGKMVRQAAVLGGLISFTVALTVFLLVYGDKVRTILQG